MALLCTPYKSLSGITVNFINFKEFETNKRQSVLESKGFEINFYTISNNKQLILSSPFATHGIDTLFYETTYGSTINPTWATIEQSEVLTK